MELYDSTPESGDDYVPDTTSKSDSDSDVSLKLNLTTKRQSPYDRLNVSGSTSPHVCDSTTPGNIAINKPTSESSGAEEGPCSSQALDDCRVVRACRKRGGNRVYDKRHYCLYCSKPYAKMTRHPERTHQEKSDVAKALSFPKGSKKRKKKTPGLYS